MVSRTLFSVLGVLVIGCAAHQQQPVGVSHDTEDESPAPGDAARSPADSGKDPLFGIDQPFQGYRLSDGEVLSDTGFLDELAQYDLVCVGEQHDSAPHHWAQLAVLHGLNSRAQSGGRELALGLEMVEAPFQVHLNRYAGGELELAQLPEKVEWKSRWGYDFALYRPLFQLARSQRISLVALNVPREVTRKISKRGMDDLDPATRNQLPEWADFANEDHRAAFDAAMQEHPHGGNPEHLYAAQVVWDESMADHAATWLGKRQPARQLVVAAGVAHCRRFAIPDRTAGRLRGVRVASVLPTQGEVSDSERLGYDFVLALGEGY